MTPFPWTDLIIIAGLIVLNGIFAMSELAIVSAKTTRLQSRADAGSQGAQVALDLAGDPGKFLSTVQIGITLVGIIAGAYSGSTLGGPVGERLEGLLDFTPERAAQVGFFLVIVLTTYFSLVIGELVPKQLALRSADRIAIVMARPMKWLAVIAAPVVWVLDFSSATIVRLFGVRPGGQNSVTAEELQMLFAEATRSGVLEAEQSAILKGVVRLADRPVREVMTPRTEVDWIDADADRAEIETTIAESPHSLLPVAEGSPDKVIGVAKVREVLAAMVGGEPFALADFAKRAEVVPDQLDAMDALRVLQQADVAMAMVHDEYGHLDGIVTPIDLLTAIVGQFESDKDQGEIPEIIERADGSLLVSGGLPAETLSDRLSLDYGEERDFATAAGFALSVLRHLPEEGEIFTYQGWQFEVIDMDGRKIDKLLVHELEPALPPKESGG